ncbi:MAG TPA: energy transducer TonB [Terracidiphilus sp.]|jgi:TonB family protein
MRLPDPSGEREFLTPILNEQPIWGGLYENVRDRFFAPKLPPLELTSQPIPVPDRMATSTNPWAVGTATLINGGLLALLLLIGVRAVLPPSSKPNPLSNFKLDDFPLFAPARPDPAHGGGGGGTNDNIDAIKGRNPKLDMHPLAPVQIPHLDHPKLAVENSVAVPPEIKLPDNPTMTMIGVHNSANVTLISGGQGGPVGLGTGKNGGDGPGDGPGWGPGKNGGFGGNVYTPGIGGVTQPVPIFTPEAEFSDEARRQKYQGVCVISVIIDAQGYPRNLQLVRTLGMGLDQKALEAVQKYRFKPARKDGKPVAARMTVMVNFRLY